MRQIILRPVKFVFGLKQSRIKDLIPDRILNKLKIYNYHIWLAYYILTQKSEHNLIKAIRVFSKRKKRILFYPDVPWERSMIYQICLILGCGLSNSTTSKFDLAVKWKDSTNFKPDAMLAGLAKDYTIVNINCNDISKSHVDRVFAEVFGYSAEVDPLTFEGKCVQKSNRNAAHDGKIIDCPILETNDDSIYQLLVDNEVEGGLVMDIRVPVIKDIIPFAFLKFRPIEFRFKADVTKSIVVEVSEIFTEEEQAKTLQFCQKIGLDYGELDVLRDRKDGRIYIVDANPTPHGPPTHLGGHLEGLNKLASTFAEAYLRYATADTNI
jgi:hypothetical protein